MTESSCLANLSEGWASPCQIAARCPHSPAADPLLHGEHRRLSLPHPQQHSEQRRASSRQPGYLPRSSDGASSRGGGTDLPKHPAASPCLRSRVWKPLTGGTERLRCAAGRAGARLARWDRAGGPSPASPPWARALGWPWSGRQAPARGWALPTAGALARSTGLVTAAIPKNPAAENETLGNNIPAPPALWVVAAVGRA